MKYADWEYAETLPDKDGEYLCRMDEDDDQPMCIDVVDGKAFQENGKRRLFWGFEWKLRV